MPTGIGELDRALSGGLVPGSVTLVGGEPGIGKSTLLLQAAAAAAGGGGAACSSSRPRSPPSRCAGAPSGSAPPYRACRCWRPRASQPCWTPPSASGPDLLVLDSIQTIADPALGGAGGSVVQVRECAARLVAYAKGRAVATVLVGHVTKDGTLAGTPAPRAPGRHRLLVRRGAPPRPSHPERDEAPLRSGGRARHLRHDRRRAGRRRRPERPAPRRPPERHRR